MFKPLPKTWLFLLQLLFLIPLSNSSLHSEEMAKPLLLNYDDESELFTELEEAEPAMQELAMEIGSLEASEIMQRVQENNEKSNPVETESQIAKDGTTEKRGFKRKLRKSLSKSFKGLKKHLTNIGDKAKNVRLIVDGFWLIKNTDLKIELASLMANVDMENEMLDYKTKLAQLKQAIILAAKESNLGTIEPFPIHTFAEYCKYFKTAIKLSLSALNSPSSSSEKPKPNNGKSKGSWTNWDEEEKLDKEEILRMLMSLSTESEMFQKLGEKGAAAGKGGRLRRRKRVVGAVIAAVLIAVAVSVCIYALCCKKTKYNPNAKTYDN